MIEQLSNHSSFKMKNQTAWYNNSDFWIKNHQPNSNVQNLLSKKISELSIEIGRPLRILDIGCGAGWVKNIIPPSSTYIGVDLCREFIKKNLDFENQNTRFLHLDFEEPISDAIAHSLNVDLVICCLSLIEMPEISIALENIKKVLTSSGQLFIVGLEPITEIYRYCTDNNKCNLQFLLNFFYFSEKPLVLEKNIKINNRVSEKKYFRILYSDSDYIHCSKKFGFSLVEKIDLEDSNVFSVPVYQFIALKNGK